MVKHIVIIGLFVLLVQKVQAQSCFAQVQFDHRSVYVQQPFKVTITVMTATWFTAPVEFDNLQVPNAFVLPFDRNYPAMFEHNGKQYAGIQFHFIVFPYRAGHFTLPRINVHATTPPEGSSESKRITIKTPAKSFTVKAVPGDAKGNWFVAKSISIREHWNRPLSHLKVGDILERTITVTAHGTLPQFIPALKEQELNFANVYPQDPELKDLRDEDDANGELTQSFTYLLEKEGQFAIPRMEVTWWNPNVRKINKRTLRAHALAVAHNPNLGMLASIKDSLDVVSSAATPPKAKKIRTILGMPWYLFSAYVVPALFLLYFILRIAIRLVNKLWVRYRYYRTSELYNFRRLRRTSPTSDVFWKRLYHWWDQLNYDDKASGLARAFERSGDQEGAQAVSNADEVHYHKGGGQSEGNRVIKTKLNHLRRWILSNKISSDQNIPERQRPWP